MLFNSYIFIFCFLPITFFVYFYLNHKRLIVAGKIFLVLSSLFFYGWWNILYLPIIVLSMLFNYFIGKSLSNEEVKNRFSKKTILICGIVSNLALLGYFKYTDFMIDNINYWIFTEKIPNVNLALPLAISFFTFQQISYLVDSYKRKANEYIFLNYALFVTFFPQLIAGPIVYHKEMIPQYVKVKNKLINHKNITKGLFIFSIGLFKKVIIADKFSTWANAGFDEAISLNFFEAWVTSLSYTFQLYFDFSGYTDMAIGLALLFNIKLPINFNSPYKATDIQDFWRRWHITLSRFLKNYLYIPFGGNRQGKLRTYNNLLVTFIIGGIWHGAGWTFVFWGLLHGTAIIIHRIWSKLGFKIWNWMAWLITFNFINFSWVFFRAKEWDDAIKILFGMLGLSNINLPKELIFIKTYIHHDLLEYGNIFTNIGFGKKNALFFVVIFLIIFLKNSNYLTQNLKPNLFYIIFISIIFWYSIYKIEYNAVFLYFNF